jgi:type I restriction enzyme S subunit
LIDGNTQLSKGSCNQDEYNKFWLREGDVIITKDSETSDDIGIPTEVKEDLTDVVCGYHLTLIRPLDVVGSYIFRFIQSDRIRRYFEINSDGVTRFGLGKPTIQNMYLPIPPLQEQQKIVDYLDLETSKIDKLVENETKRISEVVTGKVDVRDEVLV